MSPAQEAMFPDYQAARRAAFVSVCRDVMGTPSGVSCGMFEAVYNRRLHLIYVMELRGAYFAGCPVTPDADIEQWADYALVMLDEALSPEPQQR